MHLALFRVNNGSKPIEHRALRVSSLNRLDNVGKLTYTRRLDKDPVGSKLGNHLLKSRRKITDERAADTARIHLIYLNSRLCKESSVNTDLTKLVLNKNDLLARISLLKKLFNKRCFTRAEKARKNINSCHFYILTFIYFMFFISFPLIQIRPHRERSHQARPLQRSLQYSKEQIPSALLCLRARRSADPCRDCEEPP